MRPCSSLSFGFLRALASSARTWIQQRSWPLLAHRLSEHVQTPECKEHRNGRPMAAAPFAMMKHSTLSRSPENTIDRLRLHGTAQSHARGRSPLNDSHILITFFSVCEQLVSCRFCPRTDILRKSGSDAVTSMTSPSAGLQQSR